MLDDLVFRISGLIVRAGGWLTAFFLVVILAVFLFGVITQIIPVWRRLFGDIRQQRKILHQAGNGLPELCGESGRGSRALSSLSLRLEEQLAPFAWSADAWRRFFRRWRNAVIEQDARAETPVRLLPELPPSKVLPRTYWPRIASVLPGVLLSLGILGTFVGLHNVLPAVTGTLASDASNLIGEELLTGLGLAFRTSIAGLILSLLFLIADRTSQHHLEQAIRQLANDAEKLFPSLDEHDAAALRYRLETETLAQLKTLGTDIAVALEQTLETAIGSAFGTAVDEHLVPKFDQLNESLESLSGSISAELPDALKEMTDAFNENLSKAMSDQFQALTDSLKQMAETQESFRQDIELFSTRFAQQMDAQEQLAGLLQSTAEALAGVLDGLRGAASDLVAAGSVVEEATGTLATTVEQTHDAQVKLVDVQRQLQKQLAEEVDAVTKVRQQMLEDWIKVAEQATGAVDAIQESVRQLAELVGDRLVDALSQFDSLLAEAVSRFSGSLAEAKETIETVPESLAPIRETASSLEAALDQMTADVQETLQAIVRAVAGLHEGSDKLLDQLEDAVTKSEASIGRFDKSVDQTEKVVAGLPKSFDAALNPLTQLAQRFPPLVAALEKAVNELGDENGVRSSLTLIAKDVARIQGGDGEIKGLVRDVEGIRAMLDEASSSPGRGGFWRLLGGKS